MLAWIIFRWIDTRNFILIKQWLLIAVFYFLRPSFYLFFAFCLFCFCLIFICFFFLVFLFECFIRSELVKSWKINESRRWMAASSFSRWRPAVVSDCMRNTNQINGTTRLTLIINSCFLPLVLLVIFLVPLHLPPLHLPPLRQWPVMNHRCNFCWDSLSILTSWRMRTVLFHSSSLTSHWINLWLGLWIHFCLLSNYPTQCALVWYDSQVKLRQSNLIGLNLLDDMSWSETQRAQNVADTIYDKVPISHFQSKW